MRNSILTCSGIDTERETPDILNSGFIVFFTLCGLIFQEQSLIRLLEQRASAIRRHPVDWLQRLASLMAAFYIDAPQTLRLRSLNVLTEVIETFGPIYDEKLCENIIVPYLGSCNEIHKRFMFHRN